MHRIMKIDIKKLEKATEIILQYIRSLQIESESTKDFY